MKRGKSEIILIIDKSGSMESIRTDMEGGLKNYIEEQAKQPGECLVSLYEFDDKYDKVFECKNIKDVKDIKLIPRGFTALFDAIGKTVNHVGVRLAATPENDRPELVVVVLITDGFENASKEFVAENIREMIEHQKNKYNWKFIFLGANQDAVLAGSSLGIGAGSSITYSANSSAVSNAYTVLNNATTFMRSNSASTYTFSDSERKLTMVDEDSATTVPSFSQASNK